MSPFRTRTFAAIMGDRHQLRIRWYHVVRHTACRALGHKWTWKLGGRLCRRCVTFYPR